MKFPPPLVTALRTLTILPVPGDDADHPADSLVWFAVTGALIGTILWGVQALLSAILPGSDPRLFAAAVVIGGGLLTRGLHLDGLADWADAYWGGWTPERRLAIMKDSSLGTFGTVALVLLLLTKWTSVCVLLESAEPLWIVLAGVISRSIQVDLAASHDYARPEGGTGAAFITDATASHQRIALLTALVFTLALGAF
ncbi:MAG TPA: adenosylcobinamide-GDP ribazoletransferase, partial [Verrucomicrobia bacterium]|nr:adenosylcobinamide-GDP ribazoletransferase [Verrucomicrobiota bacterium]